MSEETSELLFVWLQSPKDRVNVGDFESTVRREEVSKEAGPVNLKHKPRFSTD